MSKTYNWNTRTSATSKYYGDYSGQQSFFLEKLPLPKTQYYFAFGSNMSRKRMAKRGVLWESVERATLEGFKLTFDKTSGNSGYGFATLRKSKADCVEGLLYKCESKEDALTLDLYENAPIQYKRIEMKVKTNKGKKNAFLYLATSFYKQKGLKPTSEYLEHLLEGKKYLSKEYLNFLEGFAPEVQPLRVFVYGTLKKGFGNHDFYCKGAEVESAKILGKLYERGSLPYADIEEEDFECIATRKTSKDFELQEELQEEVDNGFLVNVFKGSECIKGELITFDNWEPISSLDSLEGFFSSLEPQLNHYTRVLTTCKTITGDELSCWVFKIGEKHSLKGAELNASGSFNGYAPATSFASYEPSANDFLNEELYYANQEAEENKNGSYSSDEELEFEDEFETFNNPQY